MLGYYRYRTYNNPANPPFDRVFLILRRTQEINNFQRPSPPKKLQNTMGFYSESSEWADIVPIPQDDGGLNPLAAIAYPDEYSEAMSYLRALMARNEISERALLLTVDIIGMNPAHYTVWLVLTTMAGWVFGFFFGRGFFFTDGPIINGEYIGCIEQACCWLLKRIY